MMTLVCLDGVVSDVVASEFKFVRSWCVGAGEALAEGSEEQTTGSLTKAF